VGVHCTEFLSGIDLIAYLQDNQAEASLIILDIQMPVLDGQEVFRIIRNNDLVHHSVPVIAVTANAFDEDIQSYLTAGFDQVLSKPISKKSVVSCLNDILRHPPCD
jgi:CheY-like chemotaxis protein